MPAGQLIVLERDGHWAAALRQSLDSTRIRLIEIRSWAECWERLSQSPTAFISAEFTEAGAGEMLAALSKLDREFPKAVLIALADRNLAGYRDLIREAGAVHFIISPRRLNEVTEILRRRPERFPGAEAADNPTERIHENLPWSDAIE